MQAISIPRDWMGQTMQDSVVKPKLRELNPELHFDLGNRLNIWHPYMETRQSVFYKGRFICAMDRGTMPEIPIWTTKRDLVDVPVEEVSPTEIAMYTSKNVIVTCLKCRGQWELPHVPVCVTACPYGCENVGPSTDLERFHYDEKPSGKALVWRKVRDRKLLVSWRHTFNKLSKANIPGVTKQTLEAKFNVNLEWDVDDEDVVGIEEHKEDDFLNMKVQIAG